MIGGGGGREENEKEVLFFWRGLRGRGLIVRGAWNASRIFRAELREPISIMA